MSFADVVRGYRPLSESVPLARLKPVTAPEPAYLYEYEGIIINFMVFVGKMKYFSVEEFLTKSVFVNQ